MDTGLGERVSTAYDSLIAKLIVHGTTREDAINLMRTAIGDVDLLGIYTNQTLLRELMDQDFFRAGNTFIDTIDSWDFGARPVPDWFANVAATVLAGSPAAPSGPIAGLSDWRLK